MSKCCATCRFYERDLGSSCRHPDLAGFSLVSGKTLPTPWQAIKVCNLRKWEPLPTLRDRLRRILSVLAAGLRP